MRREGACRARCRQRGGRDLLGGRRAPARRAANPAPVRGIVPSRRSQAGGQPFSTFTLRQIRVHGAQQRCCAVQVGTGRPLWRAFGGERRRHLRRSAVSRRGAGAGGACRPCGGGPPRATTRRAQPVPFTASSRSTAEIVRIGAGAAAVPARRRGCAASSECELDGRFYGVATTTSCTPSIVRGPGRGFPTTSRRVMARRRRHHDSERRLPSGHVARARRHALAHSIRPPRTGSRWRRWRDTRGGINAIAYEPAADAMVAMVGNLFGAALLASYTPDLHDAARGCGAASRPVAAGGRGPRPRHAPSCSLAALPNAAALCDFERGSRSFIRATRRSPQRALPHRARRATASICSTFDLAGERRKPMPPPPSAKPEVRTCWGRDRWMSPSCAAIPLTIVRQVHRTLPAYRSPCGRRRSRLAILAEYSRYLRPARRTRRDHVPRWSARLAFTGRWLELERAEEVVACHRRCATRGARLTATVVHWTPQPGEDVAALVGQPNRQHLRDTARHLVVARFFAHGRGPAYAQPLGGRVGLAPVRVIYQLRGTARRGSPISATVPAASLGELSRRRRSSAPRAVVPEHHVRCCSSCERWRSGRGPTVMSLRGGTRDAGFVTLAPLLASPVRRTAFTGRNAEGPTTNQHRPANRTDSVERLDGDRAAPTRAGRRRDEPGARSSRCSVMSRRVPGRRRRCSVPVGGWLEAARRRRPARPTIALSRSSVAARRRPKLPATTEIQRRRPAAARPSQRAGAARAAARRSSQNASPSDCAWPTASLLPVCRGEREGEPLPERRRLVVDLGQLSSAYARVRLHVGIARQHSARARS